MSEMPHPPFEPLSPEQGTVWDKSPADMTAVEHFLSDYGPLDLADELVPSAPPTWPWGTA
jgi:hypothetical protein